MGDAAQCSDADDEAQVAFLLYYLFQSSLYTPVGSGGLLYPVLDCHLLPVGKIGSATNYLFELTLVASWTVGLVIAELRVYLPRGNPCGC
ncbi:hypothetical protein HS121_17405 [bacterium]|nr:hypothetical protein [bacterium]